MTVTSGAEAPASQDSDRLGPGQAELLRLARRLRAVTLELGPGEMGDLVRAGGDDQRWLWRKNDLCLLGVGTALQVPLNGGWATPRNTAFVSEVLRAIPEVGEAPHPGTGTLAMGALPYDLALDGHLVVPEVLLATSGATSWATVVLGSPPPALELELLAREILQLTLQSLWPGPEPGLPPDGFELRSHIPHAEWKMLVQRAVAQMGAEGQLSKVVLARRVDVTANRPFVLPEVLARLSSLYPSCTVFHVTGFIGASPETLVRRSGQEVLSNPLAGTVARSGDDETDSRLLAGLLSSAKDRREHQLVVDAIAERLGPLCQTLEVPDQPSVMALRNVSHLATLIKGSLAPALTTGRAAQESAGLPTALQLAALLHPTPAVGGHPASAALEWQRANEGFERGCYAGPVGWVDSRGNGEWVLGLRSANVSGAQAALYAGNGIVPGSDPDAELAETQLKLQALLAALVRP